MPRCITWRSRPAGTVRVKVVNETLGVPESVFDTAPVPVVGPTYWVSPSGVAAWEDARSVYPLQGADCCSIIEANNHIQPDDTVYLRNGMYTTYIKPVATGTTGHPITYEGYGSENITITDTAYAHYAIHLIGKSYVKVGKISSYGSYGFFFLAVGATYNEVYECDFDMSGAFLAATPAPYSCGIIQWKNTAGGGNVASTNNWFHHCGFSHYGRISEKDYEGVTGTASSDTFNFASFELAANNTCVLLDLVGGAGLTEGLLYYVINVVGTTFQLSTSLGGPAVGFTTNVTSARLLYNNGDEGTVRVNAGDADPTSYNTFEYCTFFHGGHDCFDNGGRYNVYKHNVYCNAETYYQDLYGIATNSPVSGYFGNRNLIQTNYGDVLGTAHHTLFEHNRSGHSGTSPDDDGSFGIEDGGCHTINRFNSFYNTAGTAIYLKGQPQPPAILAVTGSAATNIISSGATTHSLSTGRRVKFINRIGGSGLTDGVYYFAKVLTTTTFTVSLTDGGADVALVTDLTSAGLNKRYLRSGSWHHGCFNSIYHAGFGDPDIGSGFKHGFQDDGYFNHDYMPWPCQVSFRNNIVYDVYSTITAFHDHAEIEYLNNYESNPNYRDLAISDPDSLVLPDLQLSVGSPCINNGIELTNAVGAGNNSTTLYVLDSRWFQDGSWGAEMTHGVTLFPDWIAIGTVGNTVEIDSIDYENHTITLKTAKTWADNAKVWLFKDSDGVQCLYGTAPNQGMDQVTK